MYVGLVIISSEILLIHLHRLVHRVSVFYICFTFSILQSATPLLFYWRITCIKILSLDLISNQSYVNS